MSRDGKNVLTSAFLPGAVTNWSRDQATGALTPRECLGSTRTLFPSGGGPTTSCNRDLILDTGSAADGLAYPTDIEISADGRRVYAAALGLESSSAAGNEDEPGSVAAFDRDPASGSLSQPAAPNGCIGDITDPVVNCRNDRIGVLNPYRVAVSPDSASLYVSTFNIFPPAGAPGPGPGALALFDSSLRQLDPPCLQQFGLPAGGLQPTPGCRTTVLGLVLPTDVGFSPDGTSVYLSSLFHSVASFTRNVATGSLVQDAPTQGCSIDPRNLPPGTEALAIVCQNAVPLNAPSSVEVSPDGANVYVTSGGFLTGRPDFGPAFASVGITSDDAITVFGPAPPLPPATPAPPVPAPPGGGLGTCAGSPATIVAIAKGVVRGTEEDDVIVAGEGADRIRARGGSDIVCAAAGRDVVAGGRGADTLLGEGGRDRLSGNGGDDRLVGGKSADRLSGGPGEDRCRGGRRDRLQRCED